MSVLFDFRLMVAGCKTYFLGMLRNKALKIVTVVHRCSLATQKRSLRRSDDPLYFRPSRRPTAVVITLFHIACSLLFRHVH